MIGTMPRPRSFGISSRRRVSPYSRTLPRSRSAVRSAMSPQPINNTLITAVSTPRA